MCVVTITNFMVWKKLFNEKRFNEKQDKTNKK